MQIPDEEGIVIDGFPRDVAQAISFEDQVRVWFYSYNYLYVSVTAKLLEIRRQIPRKMLFLTEHCSLNVCKYLITD